jgi:hypothetical protein
MNATIENNKLKMHPKLLMDVIKRQAGTVEKAILEGVMNGTEAGATAINITFDANGAEHGKPGAVLTIQDDGKGIQTREEIKLFFETFGQPHEESEGKIWAQFRMGRGQLFAFGRNIWKTGSFKMDVDINNKGLDYDLHSYPQNISEGCDITIELYANPIGGYGYYSVEQFVDRIKQQVAFMPIPIYFNGKMLNNLPQDVEWSQEDDNAYYNFMDFGLDLCVYNMGALVFKQDASVAGAAGVITSKKQLKVNFARNEIQHDCPVWQHIQEIIKENRIVKRRQKRTRLTESDIDATLKDMRDSVQEYDQFKNIGMYRMTDDNKMSPEKVRLIKMPWSFGSPNDRKADRLMQSDEAIIFSKHLITDVGYDGEEKNFFAWMAARSNYKECNNSCMVYDTDNGQFPWEVSEGFKRMIALYRPFEELSDQIKDGYTSVPEDKYTVVEKRLVKALNGQFSYLWKGRYIRLGRSDEALAWTDGRTHITLDRQWVKRLNLMSSNDGTVQLVGVMAHEMAHDEDTRGSHMHSTEFLRNFHDIIVRGDANHNRPHGIVPELCRILQDYKLQERHEKAEAKKKKAEEKKKQALGIG